MSAAAREHAARQHARTVLSTVRKMIISATGQIDNLFTLEQWFADVGVSDLFTDVKVNQISINTPASGFVSFQASMIGQQGMVDAAGSIPAPPRPTPTSH